MRIFEVIKCFPREEIHSLTDQIRRSSRPVFSNLAEPWRKTISQLATSKCQGVNWLNSVLMKQHQAVAAAMQQLGGYATFGQLNHAALRVEGVKWGTKTPFASIRRIMQEHGELFFRIRPGLWGLVRQQEEIFQRLNLSETAHKREHTEEFDYGYYQGLLLQLGNLRYRTCIPAQDRNRRFLEIPLRDLATLESTPAFTYDSVLRFAKTVDVAWYNERGFPDAFFEVEHSTDIQNSLLKFLELQDFSTRFHIVADAARQREWDDKMRRTAFKVLQGRVQFLDYETLAKRHERELELVTLLTLNFSRI